MNSVGIRALKQNASEVVARAAKGEIIEITDHGKPVAKIVPLREDRYEEMVSSGQITPPRASLAEYIAEHKTLQAELKAQGIPITNTSSMTLQEILDEQREERLP
ncbi:MAG: type II toxin-antitoxin system Phd/YefM family antitoxin [Leucobacter sp.]